MYRNIYIPVNYSSCSQVYRFARFFKEISRVDELGSSVRNTWKYCSLYIPGTEPRFIESNVFKAIIPIQTVQVSGKATGEVQKVVGALDGEMKRSEI